MCFLGDFFSITLIILDIIMRFYLQKVFNDIKIIDCQISVPISIDDDCLTVNRTVF